MTDMQFAIIMTIRTGPYFFKYNEKQAIERMQKRGWVKPMRVGTVQKYIGHAPTRAKDGMFSVTKKGFLAYQKQAKKCGMKVSELR